jgi:transcriptional regulator with XRE-family HTH domain
MSDAVARRIRQRREKLGLSLAAMATASGIKSPAYVFHIENGSKVPTVPVARRIAAALGEDPEVLEAWAVARARGDLDAVIAAAAKLSRLLAGEAPVAPAAAAADTGRGIPVLPEGTDPDSAATGAAEWIDLDPRLLPPGLTLDRPFAYRLTAHGVRRIPDVVRPGDCVVLTRCDEVAGGDAAYAVRIGARIELARVLAVDGALHILDGGGGREPLYHDPRMALAGRMVVAVRRWL